MNIGNLKHRIIFINFTESVSDNGFKTKAWAEIEKAWANISNDKHSNITTNEKETTDRTITFLIRYKQIDESWRIQYGGKDYEIVSTEDKDFSKRFLSISAKEVK